MTQNYTRAELAGVEEKSKPQELAAGMTAEEIQALYFDADALREPPYRVYQLNTDGYRYYYRFNEAGEPEFYPSVTTMLRQVMPTSPFLIDWILSEGKENATEKRDMAAAYGSFMHGQFEGLIINRQYNFDLAGMALDEYMERENIPDKYRSEWLQRIRKDILAFAQFMIDYKVKPLAVEIAMVHPRFRYAGMIDLVCEMTDSKGETFRAIVDFKSGRKGFWEDHELQLHLYKGMWEECYEDIKIDRLYNFSPKDWRKAPTYNLKDQTNAPSAAKIPHLLALAAIADEKRDNNITIVRGVLDLDKGNLADNVLTLTLAELVTRTKGDKTPENNENGGLFGEEEAEMGNLLTENENSGIREISEELPKTEGKVRKPRAKKTTKSE